MKNLFSYEGKRVVITGASSGMGEATAKVVHSLGAEVVAIDIQSPKYNFADFLEVDLRDEKAISDVVSSITRQGRVHNLFYCAGLPGGRFSVEDVMTVNFIAQRYMIELMVEHMARGDAIASVSSAAGLGYLGNMANIIPLMQITDFAAARNWVTENKTQPWLEPYSFSKMCSIFYTLRAAALITQKTGVRINCTAPGPTDTAMMPAFIEQVDAGFFDRIPKPIGRNSTAEEQAWPLAFLNSDAASYISGESLYTDGGTSGGFMTGVLDPSIFMSKSK